jgi:hypothetical protein
MTEVMIAQESPPCALGLDTATLSARRDAALPPSEERRLREHVATCAACQARLAGFDQIATALRGQRELDPGDHVWVGVQTQATDRPARVATWLGSGRAAAAWRGLAAVASLVLVVGLLAAVLANGAGNRLGSGTSFKPTQPVSTQFVKPTFAPTLPPTSPALSAAQAWGTNAAIMTLNTQLDATHAFRATAISPDGRYLLGYAFQEPESKSSTSRNAGFFDLTTRRFTTIGVTQSTYFPPGCCTMDKHYLLDIADTAPGTTSSPNYLAYYSYDLNTKALWQFAKGTDYGQVERMLNDHGLVLLGTEQGIEVVDLTTHHVTQMQAPVSGATDVRLWAFTWPYVIYSVLQPAQPGSGGTPTTPARYTTRARDLETGQDIALPQVDAIGGRTMSVAGDTLFIAQAVTNVTNSPQIDQYVTTLFEDDAFFTSSAPPRRLDSYAGELRAIANARLVSMGTGNAEGALVWDRAEQCFVQAAANMNSSYVIQPIASLAGHFLAVMQPTDPNGANAQQVTIYDTDTLSTAPSA